MDKTDEVVSNFLDKLGNFTAEYGDEAFRIVSWAII